MSQTPTVKLSKVQKITRIQLCFRNFKNLNVNNFLMIDFWLNVSTLFDQIEK